MKKAIGILILGLLFCGNAYAFLITIGTEKLPIITVPPGAQCELKNNKNALSVVTPGEVIVKRSKQPLTITCIKDGYKKFNKFFALKDPKEALSDVSYETVALISDFARGDVFGIFLDGTSMALALGVNKFGTYATNKKNGKGFIYIKLFTGLDPDFIEDDQ